MKKISLILSLLILFVLSHAQTIYTTTQNYQILKENGQLNPKARYKFLNSPANTNQMSGQLNDPNLIPAPIAAKTNAAGSCQCLLPIDATFSLVPMSGYSSPYRNDDGSSLSIPLGFSFCFYGTQYNSCYINNNGNITFGNDLSSFSAGGFPAGSVSSPDTVMIAPFWADVDTRASGSGLVYYKKTGTALIVKWNNVGYYSSHADKKNDFQLIITDGNDPILPNGNNVAFCYGDMQWTTGDVSPVGNVGGFGGIPATVGVNKGDHTNYVQIGRFNVNSSVYDGPYGSNDGISFLDNKSYFFNTCGTNNNLPPIIQDATGGGSACGDTLRICALGDTLVYTTTFLAPENTQTISINGSAPSLGSNFQPLGVTTSSAGTTTFAWMVVASPTLTGVHTVVITGTDNGTPPLSSSATYFIKIQNLAIPQPTLASSPSGTVCATPGATLNLTNCASYDNVYWSNGGSGCSTVANTSGVFYVTVKKLGCFKSSSDTIHVLPNPSPVAIGTMSYCPPATATSVSLAAPLSGMAAYNTYTWTPGGISTSTASLNGTPGGKPYTISVTDVNGCTGSSTFSITVKTPSVILSSTDLVICPGECSTIKAISSSTVGPFSYAWSNAATFIGDSTIMCVGGPVSVILTDGEGCVATKTITVSANPTPTVVLPSTVSMCSGQSATVSPLSVSPTGVYSYTWSNGSHASSLIVSTATVLTLEVTNSSSGCVSIISNSCSVIAASNPTVTLPVSPVIFCNGFTATLTPVIAGGTPTYSYNWSPSSLGTGTTATTSNAGVYSVSVVDQNLCTGSATVSTIKSSPVVTLSSPDLVICPGDCSEITAAGTSSYSPFSYSWSNNSTSLGDSTLMCSAGTVTLTFTDAQGCVATNTITVINDILPVASFTATPPSPVIVGQPIDFASTSTISAGSITSTVWSFGDGSAASGNSVSYAYPMAGTYPVVVTVTGSGGCTDTYTVNYVVEAVIEIPNVFTPNGDNVNDYLKFRSLEVYGSNNLTIFNRWGKKIFEQDNYKNDWNGSGYNDGTYFFILSVPDATPNIYKGYVQLIR